MLGIMDMFSYVLHKLVMNKKVCHLLKKKKEKENKVCNEQYPPTEYGVHITASFFPPLWSVSPRPVLHHVVWDAVRSSA